MVPAEPWQCEWVTFVADRLAVCALEGLSVVHVEDLVQWHTITHVVACGKRGCDTHVDVAVEAVMSCGDHVRLHSAAVSPGDAALDVLTTAHEFIADPMNDELGGSVLVACNNGVSCCTIVVLAHVMFSQGRSSENVACAVLECQRSMQLNTPRIFCPRILQHCLDRALGASVEPQQPAKRLRLDSRHSVVINPKDEEITTFVDVGLEASLKVVEFGCRVVSPQDNSVNDDSTAPEGHVRRSSERKSDLFVEQFGHRLWPGGRALALALAKHILFPQGALRNRAVLELGAGVGLPGLVAASLGARPVWLTDRKDVLSVTKRNVLANGLADIVHCVELDWCNPSGFLALRQHFDVVIAADVVYAQDMSAFGNVLADIILADTTLVLAYTHRPHSRNFLQEHILSKFAHVKCIEYKADFEPPEHEFYVLQGFLPVGSPWR